MCLLIQALQSKKDYEIIVCNTGQHKEMIGTVLDYYGLVPDYSLDVMEESDGLSSLTSNIMMKVEKIILDEKPDAVMVHGDTTSALAVALVSFYLKIPVIHIEAGLRTGNLDNPFPEEFNRVTISKITKYHFSPNECARNNLLAEGISSDRIYVVGNTIIDALKESITCSYTSPLLDWVGDNKLVLITIHRRENQNGKLDGIFSAINRVAGEYPDVRFVFPVHKSPEVRKIAFRILQSDRIKIVEPIPFYDFHNLEVKSYFVISDSGGIQEETGFLGIPLLIIRDYTERVEISDKSGILVGTEEQEIYQEIKKLLDNSDMIMRMRKPNYSFGEGKSVERIVKILSSVL